MDEDTVSSKVSGYLEKKGKMKMMNSYKRYWFVLEGRLLLYYRSKDEYEALSPCKGSINLGPPCNVKSCPSTSGVYVFQIETRATTVTLRADNREDQNRWMQGVMSALNQNLNTAKLSHFRYSLDELPQQTQTRSFLRRKNTIPPRSNSIKRHGNKEKGIIQRLQKIGAHSYGGSTEASQIVNKCHNSKNNKRQSQINSRSTVVVENDQYGVIKKNNDNINSEVQMRRHIAENIYERISGDSSISTNSKDVYSVPSKSLSKKNQVISEQYNVENARPSTFLLENETYCGIQQNDEENKIRQTSFVMENNHYYSVDKIVTFPNTDSEVVYAEPKCSEIIDHNENNLILNELKGENAYSVTKLYDSERNNGNFQLEENSGTDGYAKIENDTKSKTKCKKDKKKQSKDGAEAEKKGLKLKKSSSFIKRVWKKKSKHKESEENIEELYEVVPDSVVEKVAPTDDTAVQMLSELQNILEHKKPFLLRQCSSSSGNTNENEQSASSTYLSENFMDNAATVEMLTELQTILKDKKPVLEDGTPSECQSTTESKENGVASAKSENPSSSRSEKMCPLLPPKHQKTNIPSPYHDVPKNNQPVHKLLPPRRRQNTDTVKSLDEILDDLEKEDCEDFRRHKVKKLIKQFSGDIDYDVELRSNSVRYYSNEDVDCNELSRLLNELSKVTCAPLLTPGVTSSLISPSLRDEELIKLLPTPTHRRRHSEPDYDIPRPHKSLMSLPKERSPQEKEIGSTRFFGPILKPLDITNIVKDESNLHDSSQLLSMTPDSLEPVLQLEKRSAVPRLWEEEKSSYTSHSYLQLKQYNINNDRNDTTKKKTAVTQDLDNIIQNDIYANPKTLHNPMLDNEIDFNDLNNKLFMKTMEDANFEITDEDLEDAYIDSLEIGNSSTIEHKS